MRYATPVQPKLLRTKLLNTTLIQPDFLSSQKMISEVYTCTNWNLCEDIILRCTRTARLLLRLVQFDFRVLHLHNLKSLSTIDCVHYTRTTWLFHYIRTTWFQGSNNCTTWNLYLYGKMTYFTLHSHNLIFITLTITWFP